MKFKYWLIVIIISLAVTIPANFNSSSISKLIIGSLIQSIILIGLIHIIALIIKDFKNKSVNRGIQKILIVFSAIIALFILTNYFFYPNYFVMPAHFRTNIFTSRCEFVPHHTGDFPWYYRYDCNISIEEKKEIFYRTPGYNDYIQDCEYTCQVFPRRLDRPDYIESTKRQFCDGMPSLRGLTCKDITTCENIICP